MNWLKKWLGTFFQIFLLSLILFQLFHLSASDYSPPGTGPDVPAQLNSIQEHLKYGSAEKTHSWYPEGAFFSYALYGYTLVNQALLNKEDTTLVENNIREIQNVLDLLASNEIRSQFPLEQSVEYGVFYQGWVNRLLGGYLMLNPSDTVRADLFHWKSAILAGAFSASPTSLLESYPGMCWPVDNIVALDSLLLHDDLYGTHYGEVVARWEQLTRSNLDPDTGLIPHYVNASSGQIIQGARGSSMVVALVFLPEIDPAFADEQYRLFRAQYSRTLLDFVFIHEYAPGVNGQMDVDSGLLVGGLSPVASGVNIAAARMHGDDEVFTRVLQLSEVLGVPITVNGAKRYMFGALPVGEEFLAWGKTVVPWRNAAVDISTRSYPRLTSTYSFWLWGIALVWFSMILLGCLHRRNKAESSE
jgi:hypothetical protein